MKTLVTGGSGFLGTHVRRFFDADDFSRAAGFDLLNSADAAMVADYDLIIHLAAKLDKDPANFEEIFRTNVDGTINVLRNVREGATFIFASTKDVYGRFADSYAEVPETCSTEYSGQSPLEWSKLIAEKYVEYFARQQNFRSCIFRLSTVYAPSEEGVEPNFVSYFADSINMGERIELQGNGTSIRDLLHVDDFSDACSAFAESIIRHGLYNVGGGSKNAVSLNDLISKLEAVSGLQAIVNRDDSRASPIPHRYVSDLKLVKHELGWAPKIDLDAGLKSLF